MLYFIRLTLISEVLVSQKKINTYDAEEQQTLKEEMQLLFSSDVPLKKKGPTMQSWQPVLYQGHWSQVPLMQR